jgi:ribosomal protein L37AE/L43A
MIAAQCYQASKYINKKFRADMRGREDLRELYATMVLPFQCPECNREFRMLSGLLEHSSSQKCSQTLDSGAIGKLVKWLNKKYIVR